MDSSVGHQIRLSVSKDFLDQQIQVKYDGNIKCSWPNDMKQIWDGLYISINIYTKIYGDEIFLKTSNNILGV